ncbi:MAG: hypothetical protein KGO96_05005 [Elusimicrobia bacterium]|nr:hypothetical protein [Elusimicrobiota bacterium]MDE2425250.1 hypothetical protein [Elusimicrobiota bacterium]
MAELDIHLRVSPGFLRLVLPCLLLAAAATELSSESVTLSTYYPAPSGIYTRMITTEQTLLARDSGSVGIRTGSAVPAHVLEVGGDAYVAGPLAAQTLTSSGTVTVGQFSTVNQPAGSAGALYFDATTDHLMAYGAGGWSEVGHSALKTEVYNTAYGSVVGQSVTCAVPGHVVIFCQTIEAPSGGSTCIPAISGNTCQLGGCSNPPGYPSQHWSSQVVCAGF